MKTEVDERTSLFADGESQTVAKPEQGYKKHAPKQHTWDQIFSPQSNLVLLTYGMLSVHTMAFDSQFPVLMHYPVQQMSDNPDVELPLKFSGGFGVGKLNFSFVRRPNPLNQPY